VLEDVSLAGSRIVAVGERGIIIYSDDDGRTWHQADVPVSVTLTAVDFPDARNGWAVGHAGIILHSSDGGSTWSAQLDGIRFARIVLADSQRHPEVAGYAMRAKRLVSDGAVRPFLAVRFSNRHSGLAVGADGIAAQTTDGGASWTSLVGRIPNSRQLNIYDIVVSSPRVLLVGEQGLIERSDDGGRSFTAVPSPRKITYFASLPDSNGIIIGGLQGRVYHTRDWGRTLNPIAAPPNVAVSGLTRLRSGAILLVTQAGQLWSWRPATASLAAISTPPLPPLTAAVQLRDGSLVLVGMGGVLRLAFSPVARSARRP
jgi:photosystem II stability/assembly factor-like uncharacterized protein